ncbi:MAG: hypothetical protein ACFFBS_06070 [Promethearchaeota archaeon]
MSDETIRKSWLEKQIETAAKRDAMSLSHRLFDIFFGAGFVTLFLIYFLLHYFLSTGFFTSGFGRPEFFLFFVPALLGLGITMMRGIVGRKNVIRPFEVFQLGLSAVGVAWLLAVFPFDFSHFADILPASVQIHLQWLSSDIVRVFMVLILIGTSVATTYNALLYTNVRQKLSMV